MELVIEKDNKALSRSLARRMVTYIKEVLRKKPSFSLVLSGGNTPACLYDLLRSDEFQGQVEWNRIDFFWGDERCVPFSDEQSNAGMASRHLLSHIPADPRRIHVIQTEKKPDEAAADYEKTIKEYFSGAGEGFDLVLLGLGDNAHTLSLFPGYEILREKERLVRAFYLEEQKMFRVTLTARAVNSSRWVVFIVSGGSKAPALQKVLEADYNPWLYPAQLIRPVTGKLSWWVDRQAAKNLTDKHTPGSTN